MVDKLRTDLSVFVRSNRSNRSYFNAIKTHYKKEKKKINRLQRRHQERIQFQIKIKILQGSKIYKSLPLHVPKFPPGFKSLRNEAYDDHHEYTDTSRTYKDDTLRTDQDDSIENIKSTKNKNDYDK